MKVSRTKKKGQWIENKGEKEKELNLGSYVRKKRWISQRVLASHRPAVVLYAFFYTHTDPIERNLIS